MGTRAWLFDPSGVSWPNARCALRQAGSVKDGDLLGADRRRVQAQGYQPGGQTRRRSIAVEL
jgi:hypothetical protein